MEGATTPVKALPIKAMSPDPGGRQTIPSNSASPGPDVLTRPSPLMSPKLGLSNFSKAAHMEKTIKEMRQHISKLKGEVDAEKTKNKQLYRDKISEIKQVKDNCAKEQEHALLNLTSKLEHHEQQELQHLRESLHKEHDQEIRLILREHEDQFKDQKVQFSEEKNEAVKVALELQKKALLEQRERGTSPSFTRPASGNSALIVKLQREIIALKDGKKELEDNYKLKCVSYNEQAEEIRRLKKNHENEVKKLLKDTKLEAAKEQQQLKKAEDALQVMSDEVKKLKDAQTSGDKIRSRSSSGSRQSRSSSNASGDHNASHISCRSNISALELSETPSSPSIDITPNSSTAVIQDYSIINKTTEGKTDNDREQALEKYIEGNQSGSEILPDGDDDCSVGGSFGPGSDERVVEGQQDSTVESDQQHQRQFSEDRDREKERQLQKKVTELNTQVTRLDKRINLLKQENDTLKKKTEEQKPSEEKIKKLKKRNAELAAIARRLEEKAKQLQQENALKRQRSVTSPSSQDVEQVKRAFAKQRAKDLADYAKKTMDKDQEIEGLRQRCQDLSDRLNASHLHEDAQNSEFYSEREELENLIKQAARDRLRLEKQITKTRQQSGADSESSVSDERLQQLLTDNAALQAELERLQAVAQKTNKLELELSQRTVECEALYKQIDEARHKSIALEEELRDIVEKNTHLTVQNSDLRARLHSLEKLSEENSDLKTSLASAERECRESQSQSDSLQKQIVSLESQLQPMKDIEERRLQLEAEQRTTLERLKQKQQEIDRLTQDKNNAAQEHQDMVADLKAKLRELERKHQLQVIEHEEIMLEMDELRKEAEIAKLRPSVNTIEIQTEKTKSTTPSPQMVANGLDNSMQTQGYPPVDRRKEDNLPQSLNPLQITPHQTAFGDLISFADLESGENDISGPPVFHSSTSYKPSAELNPNEFQHDNYIEYQNPERGTPEIDQEVGFKENRKILEYESNGWDVANNNGLGQDDMAQLIEYFEGIPEKANGYEMIYLEENNLGRLRELDASALSQEESPLPALSSTVINDYSTESESGIEASLHVNPNNNIYDKESESDLVTTPDLISSSQSGTNEDPEWQELANQIQALSVHSEDEEISTLEESGNEEEFRQIEKELEDLEDDLRESDTDEEQIDGNIDSINGSLQMEEGDMEEGLNFDEEEEEFETPDEDDYEQERTKEVLVEGSEDLGAKLSNKMNELETEHDYEPGLSLAKKMPFLVYIAKYRYDPVQYSPNENPEAELTLEQGDYVFVYGEMDEDGFFEGETMDGRRGLVPSNFVEKVPDEELEDFHVSMGLASQDAKAVNSSSLQQDLDFNSSDESEKLTSLPDGRRPGERDLTPLDLHVAEVHPRPRSLTPKQLSTITFKELDKPSQGVPYPLNLKLERQLSNSILMSWSPPEGIVVSDIQAYHLYVDGQFKMAIKATERNKALVEGVDGRRSHRVCLRTVTSKGQSRDAQCTLVVGKDASDQPTDLSVSNLTDVSAVVAWLPGNSNLDHEISIENKVRQTLSAGVYRCFLSGLAPAYQHKVTLQVKRAGAVHDTPDAATISILTLKGGTPDAPVDVQIESGPQEGSLLVTWLPVTITTAGTSNSAEVTGYALYVDGEKIKEIPSPTGDHVILEYGDLTSIGQNQGVLTVRTQSTERESADSHPVPLTTQLMKEIRQTMPKQAMPVGADNSGESSSELSDIAEVDEEEEIGTPRAHHRGRHHGLRPGGGRHHQEPPSAVSPSSPTPLEHHHYSPRGSPPRAISPTTRMSPGRLVEGGPDHHGREVVGFRPIQKGGAQSPSMMGPIPGSHMKVPHIEITKDSSGSFSASGPENFSDDELNGHSSTSAISSQQPSPIVDNRYYDDRSGRPYRPEGQQGPPTRPPPTYSTSHGANTTDSYYQDGDDIMRQQEQEYNDRNVAKMNKMNQEQSARVSSSKNHDLDSTRPSSGRHEHHRPTSGKNKRPTSGKRDIRGQEPGVQDKKRDYFDGEGSRTPTYDEDSSYSQLEDNEARTSKVIRDDIPLSDLIDYEDDGGESLIESVDMEYDDNQVRIFIALFDYDPAVMSPNPDAMEEELPFKEGQLIKIYGDKDPDGFFLGESQGRRGFVPCNMVSEVEVNDPDIAAQLLKESGRSLSRASKSTTSRGTTPRGTNSRPTSRSFSGASPRRSSALGQGRESSPKGSLPPLPPDGPIKKMVALYDYDPQHLSPNVDSELELAFKAGDNLVVYGEMDEDGFFYGEHSGRRGLVPSNFLEEIPRTPSRNGDVLRGQHKPSRTPQSRRDGTEREPDLDRSHDRDLNRRRDRDLNRSHDRDLNRERIPRDRDSRDSRERESRDRDPRDRDPRERDRDPNREKDQVRDIHRSRERDMNRIHERDMNRSHEHDLDRSRDLDHSRDSSYSKGNGVMSNRMNPSSQGAQVNSSDQVRGDKNVSFVPPTKPQRPTSPPQPNTQPVGSSVKFNPNITDSSSPAAVTRPPPPRKDPPPPAIESPPPDPHNILNLDDIGTNNKEKKKAGFFSKGIFKKFGK